MKLFLAAILAFAAVPVSAAPVHITLKSASSAAANADGFITLGSVAGLSGGDKAARSRFATVLVARAPLPGETRELTRGDISLKLRQAGINPDTQAVLEGADQATVTTAPPAPSNGGADGEVAIAASTFTSALPPIPSAPAPPLLGAGGPVIHRGDAVTIYIQSGPMTITAPATARENGSAGDMIRVHREGVMNDLSVQVLDAQTVQMEI
ncbi:MAG: flagella basal body P-ring formation protein FlgA [Janthinobacterium lividum]